MPYETTIVLKVLHQDPIPDDMSPGEIYSATITGDYSGVYTQDTQLIDDDTCKQKLLEQGSDVGFFYPESDEGGND